MILRQSDLQQEEQASIIQKAHSFTESCVPSNIMMSTIYEYNH